MNYVCFCVVCVLLYLLWHHSKVSKGFTASTSEGQCHEKRFSIFRESWFFILDQSNENIISLQINVLLNVNKCGKILNSLILPVCQSICPMSWHASAVRDQNQHVCVFAYVVHKCECIYVRLCVCVCVRQGCVPFKTLIEIPIQLLNSEF